MERNPYLYLLVRNDLDSMNAGKAVAHGAHAANQFTYEVGKYISNWKDADTDMVSSVRDIQLQRDYETWLNSANGFGVTISLSANLREMQTAVEVAKSMNQSAGLTIDPTYPYFLHQEYANLIPHPVMHPPVPHGNKGMVLCLREEITAAYVFGDKDEVKLAVGHLPLMP